MVHVPPTCTIDVPSLSPIFQIIILKGYHLLEFAWYMYGTSLVHVSQTCTIAQSLYLLAFQPIMVHGDIFSKFHYFKERLFSCKAKFRSSFCAITWRLYIFFVQGQSVALRILLTSAIKTLTSYISLLTSRKWIMRLQSHSACREPSPFSVCCAQR